jgi:hypothetical protein
MSQVELEIKLGNLSPVGILIHHLPVRSRLLVKKPWINCNLYHGNLSQGKVGFEVKVKSRIYSGNESKGKVGLKLKAFGNLSIPVKVLGELKVKVVGVGIGYHVPNLISGQVNLNPIQASARAAIGSEGKGRFSFGYISGSGGLISDPDFDIVTSLALAA